MLNIKNVLRLSITIVNKLISRGLRAAPIICAASALHITAAHAQTVQWTKYASEPVAASVKPICNDQGLERNFAKDSAGNFYVAGGAAEVGQGAVIYKFSGTTGALLWRQNYVGISSYRECATGIAVDSVGDVAVTGHTTTKDGAPTNFIAKYNGGTGALVWNVVTGFTSSFYEARYIPSALTIDASDDIIVTNLGTTKYRGKTGAELWTTHTPVDNATASTAVVVDANGDAYVTGERTIKFANSNGAELWNVATSSNRGAFHGQAIKLTPGNELVVTGYAGDRDHYDSEIVTVKFSRQTGAISWKNRFVTATSFEGIANDVVVDSTGSILVTGFVNETTLVSTSIYRLTAIKYASDGTLLWSVVVPPSDSMPEGVAIGNAIAADPSGNVFVTGSLRSNSFANYGSSQWVTLKLNGNVGTEQWRKTYLVPNGKPLGSGTAISFDIANDPVVLGYTADANSSTTVRVISYASASGALKSEASSNLIDASGEAQSAVVDNSGNLIVAGTFGGNAADKSRVIKYDGVTGQELWSINVPLAYRPLLATSANGDVFFASSSYSQPPMPGMLIKKYSGVTGQLVWDAVSDPATIGSPRAIKVDVSGDVYVTGATSALPDTPPYDARTVKFNGATGAEIWRVSYAGPGGGNDFGSAVDVSPDGNVVVASLASETLGLPNARTSKVEKRSKLNGAILWSAIFGNAFGGAPNIAIDATGNVFASGTVQTGPNIGDPIFQRVAKYAGASGALLWSADSVGGATTLSLDALGNPLIGQAVKLTKLDGVTGKEIWTTPFFGTEFSNLYVLSTGQIVASGSSYSSGIPDIRVMLYDGVTGSPVWSYGYAGGGGGVNDYLFAMVARGTSIFLVGRAQPPLDHQPNWFVQKLSNVSLSGPYPLNLLVNGAGRGSLAVSPPGSPCEPTCNGGLHAAGSVVTVTPTPSAFSVFAGWGGACTGLGACQITMSKAQFVTATFDVSQVPLDVAVVGAGTGKIVSNPAGLDCPTSCSASFPYGATVILSPVASPGSRFIGWSAGCYLIAPPGDCYVRIGDVSNVSADFSLGPEQLYINSPPLAIDTPYGLVKSAPNGISCGSQCFYTFPTGTSVTLTATPAVYSTFEGWGGYPGCAGVGPCTVTMNGNVSISPVFKVKVTTVVRNGTGNGVVRNELRNFFCGTDCNFSFAPFNAPFTLTATPLSGSVFVGWSGGGCSGRGVCEPALGTATVTATFDLGPSANDLSADGKSDLLFRNSTTGQITGWLMNGTATTAAIGLVPPGNWTVTHTADFNGDGKGDILFRNDDGAVTIWLMNGLGVVSAVGLLGPNPDWRVSHVADFNGDGKVDILWRNTNGAVTLWLMDGATVTSSLGLLSADPNWTVSHIGDFNGDGKADLLWRKTDGAVTIWLMDGISVASAVGLLGPTPDWRVTHVADFDGDGKSDLLGRNTNGAVTMWLMNGARITKAANLSGPDANLSISHTGDFNGDGKADLLWRNTNGAVTIWLMNGASVASTAGILGPDPNWRVSHLGDYNGDGKADLVWRNTNDGSITMWLMNGTNLISALGILGATTWGVVPPMP
jgi:outer membrane protein assembly factor BamB